jgi:hypothetical protein
MRRALVPVLIASAVVAGCSGDDGDSRAQARPEAGEAVDRYAEVLGDMVRSLDRRFGTRPWGPRPGRDRLTTAECDGGVTVALPDWTTTGRYPRKQDVAKALDPVLEEHGFSALSEPVGKKIRIRKATDERDGLVTVHEGAWTVISMRTGCSELDGELGDFPLEPSGQKRNRTR